MLNIFIVIAAVILLAVLLYFERARDYRGVLPVKTALSCLFVLTALVQPHPLQRYYFLMLAGLIFCLGGDVFLALQREKAFLSGLVSFLLGHVCYAVAFFQIGTLNAWLWGGAAGCVILGAVIYSWLYPRLGDMKLPVFLYVLVISAMVAGAFSSFGATRHPTPGRLLVLSGALLFYFSDIFVARDRFMQNAFSNRLIGLPVYYLGQFLLAFSIGLVGN